jgi:DMSO/TMAO reductase YedYZ molybdopterin-dependent catalytic subunit
LIRSAALLGGSAIAYGAVESALRVGGLPGATRRFTGSYRGPSSALPVTQWLTDGVPRIDVERWRLSVRARDGELRVAYPELARHRDRINTVLDCTGGWFSTQEWEGIRLDRLIGEPKGARSIEIVSSTGYSRRFPIDDAPRLVLAVRMAGRPLEAGHGFPARLVAPGRRGFWWVKWVDLVELSDTPWWWQAPFPLT